MIPSFYFLSVTTAIILINIIAYIVLVALSFVNRDKNNTTFTYEYNKLLYTCGSKFTYAIIEDLEIWRLFAPIVFHVDIIHLVCNTLALFLFSYEVEKFFRYKAVYLLTYIVMGYAGNVVSAIFNAYS